MNSRSSSARTPVQTWPMPVTVTHGERIWIGNILPLTADGTLVRSDSIAEQTHAVFQRLRDALHSAGAELADLVRINTYYVYHGAEDGATRYWEGMTAVRLQYFADPGPVGTAVRVAGTAVDGILIQLEAEALLPAARAQRQRIMPADSWDWSVPVPLSQGWRQNDHVWVGGQVCADRSGKAVHLGDLRAQTSTVLRYISNVLHDAGAVAAHLLHLKICYLHDGDGVAAQQRLLTIRQAIADTYGSNTPAITAFGVNLLYEGLLLEIDASAVMSTARADLDDSGAASQGSKTRHASRRGRLVQVGGYGRQCNGETEMSTAIAACSAQCLQAVAALGGDASDVCRLTAFVAMPVFRACGLNDVSSLLQALRSLWPEGEAPAITISLVEGLPDEASVQVDALACLPG